MEQVDGIITQVICPFPAPAFYSTVYFTAPVIRGEKFAVRKSDGSYL